MFFKHLATSNHLYSNKQIHNFPGFFRPLFHSTGLKAKSYMLCSIMWFWTPICAPRGPQNATTGAQFSPKRPQMRGPPNYLGRLGGDLGDQRSKNSPSLRLHRFKGRIWGDFMLDFKHIWIRFRSNLSYHLWSLISIPKALLIEVFPTVSSCSDLAANNKQQVKTIM